MQSRRGVAIVLSAVVIWSTTPVFIDHLQTVDRLSPLQISTWRAFLVTLLLVLYLLVRDHRSSGCKGAGESALKEQAMMACKSQRDGTW